MPFLLPDPLSSDLKERLAELDEEREAAEEALERDAETLLDSYASMVPEGLDALSPDERQRVYKMMRLKVRTYTDGHTELNGTFSLSDGFTVRTARPIGRKTGKERTTPLLYLEDGENLVVASVGGAPKHPA